MTVKFTELPRIQSIEDRWRNFEEKTIPPDASEGQRRSMKTAFYAGCLEMHLAMGEAATADDNDDNCVILIELLAVEVHTFFRDITGLDDKKAPSPTY